jgi:hypothetical protein
VDQTRNGENKKSKSKSIKTYTTDEIIGIFEEMVQKKEKLPRGKIVVGEELDRVITLDRELRKRMERKSASKEELFYWEKRRTGITKEQLEAVYNQEIEYYIEQKQWERANRKIRQQLTKRKDQYTMSDASYINRLILTERLMGGEHVLKAQRLAIAVLGLNPDSQKEADEQGISENVTPRNELIAIAISIGDTKTATRLIGQQENFYKIKRKLKTAEIYMYTEDIENTEQLKRQLKGMVKEKTEDEHSDIEY